MSEASTDRALGRLEEGVKAVNEKVDKLTTFVADREDKAGTYRQEIRDQLRGIDNKVDPMKQQIETHELTLKAHEAEIKLLLSQRDDMIKTVKVGKRIAHAIWIMGIAVWLLLHGDFKGFMKLWH